MLDFSGQVDSLNGFAGGGDVTIAQHGLCSSRCSPLFNFGEPRLQDGFILSFLNPAAIRYATVLLLLGCGFAFCQQRAFGSCGDYLQMGNAHDLTSQSNAATEFRLADFAPAANSLPLSVPPTVPRPCHGPGCSQAPEIPLTHLSDTTNPSRGEVVAMLMIRCLDDIGVVREWFADQPVGASELNASIFRPPRLL
ncbi:hypothetical protein CGZ80_25770 [Rhodopirellula sp. MGV]|nr:hypothetical protein CGZ80_25770 [Rhodopirellula sp. MGV]PNY36915.1 hypothetical protein C2E31_09835 [Rhodopirellula baltica]